MPTAAAAASASASPASAKVSTRLVLGASSRKARSTSGTPTTSAVTTATVMAATSTRALIGRPPCGAASSFALEAEPDASHRSDEPRVGGIVAQLLAQPRDMHVQCLGRAPPGGVPDLAHQLLTGDDLAVLAQEHAQQVELLRGQRELLLVDPCPVRLDVDPHPVHALGDLDPAASQQGADP